LTALDSAEGLWVTVTAAGPLSTLFVLQASCGPESWNVILREFFLSNQHHVREAENGKLFGKSLYSVILHYL
jgi:hypothetical protein